MHIDGIAVGQTNQQIGASLAGVIAVNEGVTKAVFYHCLKIVMDGSSFRSSDSTTTERGLYTKMFPDSKFAHINCGKTKATYVVTHGIAPYVREQMTERLAGQYFGLHVDESTHNGKCRIEYWITYFNDKWERENHYLCSDEFNICYDR